MGGREGMRGYTYQTIIGVMQSLSDSSVTTIQVEPDTANEKVDIILEYSGQKSCLQVKSSINNFQKSEIIRWLEEMIHDIPDAKSYELILIGNMTADTNSLINQISSGTGVDLRNEIVKARLNQISIKLLPFERDLMENKIWFEVSKFLSASNIHLRHDSIELIAMGLIYQFFQFSIIGRKVTREQIQSSIIKWAQGSYPREFQASKESVLGIEFYDKANHRFIQELNLEKLAFPRTLIQNQLNLIQPLYHEARLIKLPPQPNVQALENNGIQSLLRHTSLLGEEKEAEIFPEWKAFIQTGMNKWFKENIADEFFNVGNLKERLVLILSPHYEYFGTEQEKRKAELIRKIYWGLRALEQLSPFIEWFRSHYYLPLAVTNSGQSFDEDITVDLKFPTDVEIMSPDRIQVPDDYGIVDAIIKEDLVGHSLIMLPDSMIKAYDSRLPLNMEPYENLDLVYSLHSPSDRLSNKKSQLILQMRHTMDYKVFYDQPGIALVRFQFKKLTPNVHQSFPCLLLIKASESLKIEYAAYSKHSGKINTGILHCEIGLRGCKKLS